MQKLKDKIQQTKDKVIQDKLSLELAEKQRLESMKPLITKDDLVGAISKISETNTNEVKNTIDDLTTLITEIESKIEGKTLETDTKVEALSKGILKLKTALETLEIPDISNLISKEELKAFSSQIEAVKSLIPKEKEITTKDIKGLGELLNSFAQPTSQPITIDILSSGNLIKSGASKLNFPGATITQEGNITTITPAPGTTSWGAITGTLSDQTDLQTALNTKQDTLVSGTNIKTVNGVSVLGSGDIPLPNGTSINNVSADTTIPLTDGVTIYLVDASAGPINISMPTTTANTGQYTVKKVDTSSNVVTVIGVINGFISPTIDFENESWTMVSTGVEFEII